MTIKTRALYLSALEAAAAADCAGSCPTPTPIVCPELTAPTCPPVPPPRLILSPDGQTFGQWAAGSLGSSHPNSYTECNPMWFTVAFSVDPPVGAFVFISIDEGYTVAKPKPTGVLAGPHTITHAGGNQDGFYVTFLAPGTCTLRAVCDGYVDATALIVVSDVQPYLKAYA